jgi:hypothetical protein
MLLVDIIAENAGFFPKYRRTLQLVNNPFIVYSQCFLSIH